MNVEIIKIEAPEMVGVEPSRAEQIRAVFAPMATMVAGFEERFRQVQEEAAAGITREVCAKARRVRLDMVKVRGLTENVRKAQKEEYLRAGKAIDGVSNVLKWAVQEKENILEKIERHFEEQERARLQAIQVERVEQLVLFMPDAGERDLAGMADDVWQAYLAAKKKDHADRLAAERRAEEEREAKARAEADEQVRIRQENARLKAEAERQAAERRKAEEEARREREAAEAAARKEREAIQAKADAERREREAQAAKERAEADRALREEREKRERAEREAAAQRAAAEAMERERREEARRAAEEQERKEQEAAAMGDRDKLAALVEDLAGIKVKYQFRAKKNRAAFADVCEALDEIINILKGGK